MKTIYRGKTVNSVKAMPKVRSSSLQGPNSFNDADVIKTYVELGLGIGILAEIAFIPERELHLRRMNARHLFKPSSTRIAIRKNVYLRAYTYDFITLFAQQLTREVVTKAMHLSNSLAHGF